MEKLCGLYLALRDRNVADVIEGDESNREFWKFG